MFSKVHHGTACPGPLPLGQEERNQQFDRSKIVEIAFFGWVQGMLLTLSVGCQALPSRAGSLSHSLAASAAAAEYDSLEDECQQQTIDHLAEKVSVWPPSFRQMFQ